MDGTFNPPPLSPQQTAALNTIRHWLEHETANKQVFNLRGPAGTGKTTLARHAAALAGSPVCFGSFTGKAAQVMRRHGCEDASTLHSLIYFPVAQPGGSVRYLRNPGSDLNDATLVIVDEVSMIGDDLARDLLSFGRPVLALGDPAQLPAINGEGFFSRCRADFELTEIHRQAKGDPIIDLATIVRQGGHLVPGDYGTSRVLSSADLDEDTFVKLLLDANQILVGTNQTRHEINAFVRRRSGRASDLPEPGDRLVCLRNDPGKDIFNGALYRVLETGRDPERSDVLALVLTSEDFPDEKPVSVRVLEEEFLSERDPGWQRTKGLQRFTYGYSLTTHKAQGSQWDNVVVIDESDSFRENARRWLYTAITRAAERVTILV